MVKSQLEQGYAQKNCYGTNEWSNNSGICNNCRWKEACGKANASGKINQITSNN